jgi:translation initiation factor IF-2
MENKKGFTRITVDQMREKQEQLRLEKMIEHTMTELEVLIEEEAEKLAQELVDSGMDVDSFEIATDQRYEDGKIVVTLYVVQEGKTLQFDLKA